MEKKRPSQSSEKLSPLSEERISRASKNLENCLTAYDKDGEAGLQKALDKIYPPPPKPKKMFKGVHFDWKMPANPEAESSNPPSPPSSAPKK